MSGRAQAGSAMLMAVFVLVLLTGIGTALLFLSQSELSLSRSTNEERAAFHLAEAGIEAGRMALLATNGAGSLGDDLVDAAGADLILNLDPGALDGTFGAGSPTITGAGDDVPLSLPTLLTSAEAPAGYYAAFLSNDPVEGIGNQTDLNRRVMITAIGITENDATEVAQAIVEPSPVLPSVPTAALTLLGPPPAFDNGSSGSQAHNGQDCPAGGGSPGLFVPIVGTTGAASQTGVQTSMSGPANFVSGAITGQGTIGDLTNPADPAMAQSSLPAIDPAWLDCAQIAQLVQDLISIADYYCNTDLGACVLPPGAAGEIMVVDGDADAGAGFSAGLLLVTGELIYSGSEAWDAIVLVLGEGRLRRNGGGDGQNSGAVVLANIDPSPGGPRADKSDWCASGFGATSFDVNGGGNSAISYCSTDVINHNPVPTYRVTEFLQR